MKNEKILSLLGLARRAGKISLGHDAAIGAIVKNSAKLCLIASDASQRLKNEFSHACSYEGKTIDFIEIETDMLSLSKAVGSKAAVLTVDDEGFAKKIASLLKSN
ncbi:MAG: ribosomal L7Ae/L30e/S12e/Gadd45 family protein [Clostridia bacterium]|nr:ribosomal L7Ae/L30e/S12e/Gadd45 family protein [Clostridia bacterium]